MQIKKNTVREKLLAAGRSEFLALGFEKTSIRTVVRAANTTIGNFYNYFESKEALFSALVDGIYTKFKRFLSEHHNIEGHRDLLGNPNMHTWRAQLQSSITMLMPIINTPFLLLLNCSSGTKYEGAKEQFIELLSTHFEEHIAEFTPDYPHPEIGRIIAEQLVDGFASIIARNDDETKRTQLIVEQIYFTSAGIYTLLLGGNHD